MDSLKDIKSIIAIANTAALLGVSIYFYRRLKQIDAEMATQSSHLKSTIKKVRDMQIMNNHISKLAAAIKDLNAVVANCTNQNAQLQNIIQSQQREIAELQKYVSENGGNITPKTPQMLFPKQENVFTKAQYKETINPELMANNFKIQQPKTHNLIDFDLSTDDVESTISAVRNANNYEFNQTNEFADLGL